MPVATSTTAAPVNGDAEQVESTFDHLSDNYEFHFVKKIEGNIKLEPGEQSPKKEVEEPIELFETVETHADKQLKLNDGKAKKIRRLGEDETDLDDRRERRHSHEEKEKKFPVMRIFFILTVASAIALMFFGQDVCDDLIRRSRQEYNILLQGKEYCTDELNYLSFARILRDNIVGQDKVMEKLDNALKNHKSVTSIVFYGPSGSGKTLTTQLIAQKFRWQENIQMLISSERDLAAIVRRMSKCGHNLLIIDDLYLVNRDILDLRQNLEAIAEKKGFNIVLIFVFNLSKLEAGRDVDGTGPIFSNISGHHLIEFRRLDDLDLDKCMDVIEAELAVTLSEEQRKNVKESVDVLKSGCKTVRSKVKLYS